MKKKIFHTILMVTKYTLYCWIILVLTGVAVTANPVNAQIKSVKEVVIDLEAENIRLDTILSAIERKTDFQFFYTDKSLQKKAAITLKTRTATVADHLLEIARQANIDFKQVNNNISVKKSENFGERKKLEIVVEVSEVTVSGKVTDERDQPLPGATILEKGTANGTMTDINGNYSLTISSPDAILVFSFVGYLKEEIPVNNQLQISISLFPDIVAMNEVIVVGYGKKEKKEVTGSIAQVSGSEITKSSAISVSNALAGRVPGLIINQSNAEPGRDEASILIRGIGTTGNASPLIVVDGVANRDGISRIDPNDIESVTVLKDASAAIYGAQAANGVILVTTKRGKEGKPTINYSFNQGFVSPTRKIELADAALYAESVNTFSRQQGQPEPYSQEQISDFRNGTTPSTDWIDEVYKSYSIQRRHNLSLSGGNEFVRYFLSGGTAFQDGLMTGDETTEFRQYNFRSNIDVNVTKDLTLGLDIAGRREDRNWLQYDDASMYGSTIRSGPDLPATINGLPARGRENFNPLAVAQGPGYLNVKRNVFQGTFSADYKIPFLDGLAIGGWAAVDVNQGLRKHFYQQFTFYDDIDDDGVLDAVKGGPGLDGTFLRQDDQNWQSVTLHGKISYEKTFGVHDIEAFVAYEQNEVKADSSFVQRNRYQSDRIDQIFAGSSNTSFHRNSGGATEFARQNYFGRISYSYMEKYMAQFHFRYDGSSIFPAGERFGFFPGVSVGWRISEESFLKNNNIISELKLRGSWGKLGNDRVNAFQYLNLFTFPTGNNTGYVFGGADANILNPGVAANPNITWETVTTLNFGVDGGLFENRITYELDIFKQSRENILGPRNVTVPNYTGIDLPDENIRDVDNKGFEAQALYRNTIGEVSFSFGGNFTYAKSEVKFIDEEGVYPEDYQNAEGHPVGAPLVYDYLGIYRTPDDLDRYPGLNGNAAIGDPYYRDVNEDGQVDNADRIRIDLTDIPQVQYGIVLGAEYKGFDLSALFQGQAKAQQYLRYTFNNGNNAMAYFLENAYDVEANPNGSLPAFNRHNTNDFLSTLWLRDVSFLRLKNIELGYSLPQNLIGRVGLQTVRVYVNGYNLLTFDELKKDGLPDPESVNIEGWQYPHTKSFNFGLNVTL